MFIIHLNTKCQNSSGSLVIAVKVKAKENVRTASCFCFTFNKKKLIFLGSEICPLSTVRTERGTKCRNPGILIAIHYRQNSLELRNIYLSTFQISTTMHNFRTMHEESQVSLAPQKFARPPCFIADLGY
jgi:hypothetical protein